MKISIEDIVLYAVIAGVFIFLGFYFIKVSEDLSAHISKNRTEIKQQENSVEMTQTILRYDFANNVLISNSARFNMSFMIGSVISVMGAMIVVRRVRTEANAVGVQSSGFTFNFSSNSPGLTLCLFGGIIVCLSVIYKDKYNITDSTGTTQSEFNIKNDPAANDALDKMLEKLKSDSVQPIK